MKEKSDSKNLPIPMQSQIKNANKECVIQDYLSRITYLTSQKTDYSPG